jgi:2-dehydropantoate 2-reductase
MSTGASPASALVMGAGSVGTYVGGCLRAAGVRVVFVGRPRMLGALRENGLRLTDLDGGDRRLEPSVLELHERPPSGLRPDLVLLAVKSVGTEAAARQLQDTLPAGTPVISMQNGIGNAQTASRAAPQLRVLAGMVPFNVAELAPGWLHRGTSGTLAVQHDETAAAWSATFRRAGLPVQWHGDLLPVQWGKLLLNLNNPVNALSGLPLREQLLQRESRRELAGLIDEALVVLHANGIEPARLTPLPWVALSAVLCWPTPLFRLVAARMLRIDPKARSSMADDLAHGRPTEIDALCGEVVAWPNVQGVRRRSMRRWSNA